MNADNNDKLVFFFFLFSIYLQNVSLGSGLPQHRGGGDGGDGGQSGCQAAAEGLM